MIIVDATGNITAVLNNGPADTQPLGWMWTELGQISPPVGDAAGVRFADLTVRLSRPSAWMVSFTATLT